MPARTQRQRPAPVKSTIENRREPGCPRCAALEAELREAREQHAADQEDHEFQLWRWAVSQRELNASRERYTELFEEAPVGYLSLDANGFIREVNLSALRMFGLERGELLDTPFFLHVAAADRRLFLKHLNACRRSRAGKNIVSELRLIGRDQSTFVGQLLSTPEPGAAGSGGKLRIRTALIDRSEQRRAEQALQASEARYRSLFEGSLDGIFALDAEGAFAVANAAITRISGYALEELMAMNIRELLPAEERERVIAAFREALRGQSRDLETTILHKNGQRVCLLVAASPMRENDQVTGVFGIARDITARKTAEEQLRRLNTELEARVEERTTELRALAVEITRTEERERRRLAQVLHDDLQQILVGAQIEAEGWTGRGFPKGVREAGQRIARMTGEAINVSKSLTAELSPPILHERGLKEALAWLGRWMKSRHHLQVKLTCGELPGQPDHQVAYFVFIAVRELLLNVVKHAGVRQARVRLGAVSRSAIRVEVSDAGCGMRPPRMPDSKLTGGFGLLSLRERLRLLGGDIQIRSAPGKGTRVSLRAPLVSPDGDGAGLQPPGKHPHAPAGVARARRARPRASKARRLRILLADDHTILRNGLAMVLGKEPDLEVVGEAANGREAVELARALRPDLAIMDLSMPEMNGIEATRAIAAECPEVRVVGLLTVEEADRVAAMLEAGAVDYVHKGAPSGKLLAAVRGAAGASSPRAANRPKRRR